MPKHKEMNPKAINVITNPIAVLMSVLHISCNLYELKKNVFKEHKIL